MWFGNMCSDPWCTSNLQKAAMEEEGSIWISRGELLFVLPCGFQFKLEYWQGQGVFCARGEVWLWCLPFNTKWSIHLFHSPDLDFPHLWGAPMVVQIGQSFHTAYFYVELPQGCVSPFYFRLLRLGLFCCSSFMNLQCWTEAMRQLNVPIEAHWLVVTVLKAHWWIVPCLPLDWVAAFLQP